MNNINFEFDNVYLLFLIIPLVFIFVVPLAVIFIVKKDTRNGHSIASICLHVVLAVLISFTAAGTSVVTTLTETNIYVVADVSYSANKNLDLVDSYIRNIDTPPNSKVGVICFGKDSKLLTRLGERYKSVKEAQVDDSETNIQGALEFAGSLFKDGVIKRIVLITDGKQTYEGDANALRRTVENLNARNIFVDAMYLDDNISDTAKEVQISGAEFSSNAYLDCKEVLSVTVNSTYETEAILTLYKDGEQVSKIASALTSGTNTAQFNSLDTSTAGTFEYRVEISADGDENASNNSYEFTQTVTDDINVLVITEREDDLQAVSEILGERANIDGYLNATDVPTSIEELCRYDEVVISNADVTKINNYQMFLRNLNTAVSSFGKSLLTFGDLSVQNKTEGELDILNEMLPVGFGNNSGDPKLFTIVLDGSRSMFTLSKFDRAKKAAKRLVDLLNEEDSVCIISFHGEADAIQVPPVKLTNKDKVKADIDALTVSQGTLIGNGLNEAYKAIKPLRDYSEKQVMLISDGLNYANETYDPMQVVKDMYNDGIFTSVIDVGRGAANDQTAKEAKTLLENLASQGKGNYFFADTEEALEDVVFGEIGDIMKETVVDRNTRVKVNRRRDETIADFADKFSSYFIRGFLNGSDQGSATVVLCADYRKSGGTAKDVPLYAYRTHTNGRVASFTSDISGRWIEVWKREGGPYKEFFESVFKTNMPSEKVSVPFVSEIFTENGSTAVKIIPAAIRSDASAKLKVTMPDGTVEENVMAFDSAEYSRSFISVGEGGYKLEITYSYADTDYTRIIDMSVPYKPEYDSFAVFDASGLYRMLSSYGTVSETGELQVVNDESVMGSYVLDLTIPLLIVSVVLFAVDIVIRKLKWEDIKSLFVKVDSNGGKKK